MHYVNLEQFYDVTNIIFVINKKQILFPNYIKL